MTDATATEITSSSTTSTEIQLTDSFNTLNLKLDAITNSLIITGSSTEEQILSHLYITNILGILILLVLFFDLVRRLFSRETR